MNGCCHLNSQVLSTRSTREGATIRRRRKCDKCGHRFTTFEHLRDEPSIPITQRELLIRARRLLIEIGNRSTKVDHLLSTLDPELALARPQIPVDELNLSTRSSNALKRANIKCVSQLVECTQKELLNTRNIGPDSVKEITEALELIGITLSHGKTILS